MGPSGRIFFIAGGKRHVHEQEQLATLVTLLCIRQNIIALSGIGMSVSVWYQADCS